MITHCCLEPHGAGDPVAGRPGERSGLPRSTSPARRGQLAPNLKVPAANIQGQHGLYRRRIRQQVHAGQVGAKPAPSFRRRPAARPVKLFLDRATEQLIAGNRPSAFAKIKIGGKKDGTITAWQSQSWGTGGFAGGGQPAASLRRRPHSQQAPEPHGCLGQCGPGAGLARAQQPAGLLPDLQRAGGFRRQDRHGSHRSLRQERSPTLPMRAQETYRYQLRKAAELAEWKKLWHPRGQGGAGPVKRGLGLAYQRLGRRRPQQPVPRHHPRGWLGGGGDRHPGPRHRNPHHHHAGGGRDRWGCR